MIIHSTIIYKDGRDSKTVILYNLESFHEMDLDLQDEGVGYLHSDVVSECSNCERPYFKAVGLTDAYGFGYCDAECLVNMPDFDEYQINDLYDNRMYHDDWVEDSDLNDEW